MSVTITKEDKDAAFLHYGSGSFLRWNELTEYQKSIWRIRANIAKTQMETYEEVET